jgi:methionyl-tRNA synthetase
VHLLAKDILRFHCIYWPALLLAAGDEPPKQLFVHGYLNLDDRKMSKSLGNVIDPLELIDVYGADAVRFYAARATTFGQDGNVSVDDVRERYERELANDLGNLVSRTTAMISRYRGGSLEQTTEAPPWDADALRETLIATLDRFEITAALEEIWVLVRRLNQYVEQSAPWQLAKDDARAAELTAVLYNLADGLTAVAVALSAYLPESAARILAALGQPADDLSLDRIRHGTAVAVRGIEPAPPLFPRVELPAAAP